MPWRVTIDRLRPADAGQITQALRDWQVVRWLSVVPWPYGSQDAEDFIARAAPDEFAIRVDGEFAGTVRAGRDFGIWVAQPFQRQGIALRASILALSRAFVIGGDVVASCHLVGNHRSAALLARLGFRDIGSCNFPSRAEGRVLPGRRLQLNRADFAARHGIAIVTRRLRIDAVRPNDLADLYRIATLPEVARMLVRFYEGMPMNEFVAHFPRESLLPPFRLTVRQEETVAGSIGISAGDRPSVFYFLDPALRGRGLGSEMVMAFVPEVIARYGHASLRADVFTDNPQSRKILERAGFALAQDISLISMGRNAPAPAWHMEWRARSA